MSYYCKLQLLAQTPSTNLKLSVRTCFVVLDQLTCYGIMYFQVRETRWWGALEAKPAKAQVDLIWDLDLSLMPSMTSVA